MQSKSDASQIKMGQSQARIWQNIRNKPEDFQLLQLQTVEIILTELNSSYNVQEWDNLMLVLSLPNLLLLSYWFILPESPRYMSL